MVSWRHVQGRNILLHALATRDRARATVLARRSSRCNTPKDCMVLVLLHFKERQSHQRAEEISHQAEEISGLADGTSTRTELRITPRPHGASVQAHESAKEELCLNFNLLKSG
jgi:hypothetical protein